DEEEEEVKRRRTDDDVGQHHAAAQRDAMRERGRPREPLKERWQLADGEESTAEQVKRRDDEAHDRGESVVVPASRREGHDRRRKREPCERRRGYRQKRFRNVTDSEQRHHDPEG